MYILAIDQGTSSTKALLFDEEGKVVKKAVADLQTNYFPDGRVEQNPFDIVESVKQACTSVLQDIPLDNIASIGISNQRETFVLFDKDGQPIYPAVVWACKRSTSLCAAIKDQEPWVKEKTGLLIDPYFSGSKLLWILENEPEVGAQIAKGEIHFGTVDTWLLYNLTDGDQFLTDHTNASRTLFFNINDLDWDAEILEKWQLQSLKFPAIKPSSASYGSTDLFGLLPKPIAVTAMIGDSHAAMFGEACLGKGDTKITLGTGCSMLMHIGGHPKTSTNGLLSTIGWSTGDTVAYAWEGAIVACGSMIEWLKSLGIIRSAEETSDLARSILEPSEIYLIPAFSGLGAPFWQMDRKASFHGLTFGSSNAHMVKATLESVCFQIKAVIDAMEKDLKQPISQIAMHGGLSKNLFIRDYLAKLIDGEIKQQENQDISAQGAAFLSGLEIGIFKDLKEIKQLIQSETVTKDGDSKNITRSYKKWFNLVVS